MVVQAPNMSKSRIPDSSPRDPSVIDTKRGLGLTIKRVMRAKVFGYIASIVSVLILWELVVVVFAMPEYTLPSPIAVFDTMIDRADLLWTNTLVTIQETLVGFAAAVAIGVPIGAAISFSRAVELFAYPLLVTSQALPKVALAPLFLIWFGYGVLTITVVTASIAVFPIIINTTLGLSSIDDDMVRLGKVMGASKWRLFTKIRVPFAMPNILAGMKLGITLALIGAVVGEFVAASAGLGYLAQNASGALDTTLTFACLVMLSFVGIVLFLAVEGVERLVTGWHPSQRNSMLDASG